MAIKSVRDKDVFRNGCECCGKTPSYIGDAIGPRIDAGRIEAFKVALVTPDFLANHSWYLCDECLLRYNW